MWHAIFLLILGPVFAFGIQNYSDHADIMKPEDQFGSLCETSKILTANQRRISYREGPLCVEKSVVRGTKLAKEECARQFKNERWSCSVKGESSMLGQMTRDATREAAFTYAVVSAGIAYRVAKDCKRAINRSALSPTEYDRRSIRWDNYGQIAYGMDVSRKFLDNRKAGSVNNGTNLKDFAKRLMDSHNNEAGRQAILKHRTMNCKCHGLKGSCTIKTCWEGVKNFNIIGEYLKKKYSSALKVKLVQREGKKKFSLAFKTGTQSAFRKSDLVYLDESPNYCLGTLGRHCNPDTNGTGSCDVLCCGRGYKTERKSIIRDCRCSFVWCCNIICKKCLQVAEEHTCL